MITNISHLSSNRRVFLARIGVALLALIFILGIIWPLRPAHAAGTIYVNAGAVGSNNGSSWTNAYKDLQSALFAASPGDQIWVVQGTYYPGQTTGLVPTNTPATPPGPTPTYYVTPTPASNPRTYTYQLKNGVAVYGGFAGGETDLSQRDWMAHQTVLSGDIGTLGNNTDNCYHVVTASANDASAVLDGFTIQDGNANGASSQEKSGGGIFVYQSSPTLSNLTIYGNTATERGGGMFNTSNSNPVLTNVTFTINTAWKVGGGMFNDNSSPLLRHVFFYSNGDSGSGSGGAMGNDNSSPVAIDVTFSGNEVSGDAGAILNIMNSNPVLINATFRANYAGQWGGAIYNSSGTILVTNAVFVNNIATFGGAIDNDASITLVQVTFSGNSATSSGGAFQNRMSNAVFKNVILWGNSAPAYPQLDNWQTSAIQIRSSLIQGSGGSGTSWNSYMGVDQGGNLDLDPLFVNSANGDLHLRYDSPAVDAGDSSALPADTYDLNTNGNSAEPLPFDMDGQPRIQGGIVDMGAYEARFRNNSWILAKRFTLGSTGDPNIQTASADQYVSVEGQSRWYKFSASPNSRLNITLTNLPANYDLTVYKDIPAAYTDLRSPQDLVRLSAEFAPDMYSPDMYSPDMYSPDMYSPDMYSPDMYSPDMYSPDMYSPDMYSPDMYSSDMYSPDMYSPDMYSPDMYSPDMYSPDMYSPDMYSPDMYSPDMYSPDMYSPDMYSPEAFSSAQTRSLIGFSAFNGTTSEGILLNTWNNSGDFYVRVHGRNGAFSQAAPFHLSVTLLTGACGEINPILPPSNTPLVNNAYKTIILTDLGRMAGTDADKSAMHNALNDFVNRNEVGGVVVDVGADAAVQFANAQADAQAACPYAKNLVAGSIRGIIDGYRKVGNPLEYVVLVGNDNVIPFFRHPDNAMLANEMDYTPPVRDNTSSQASLKLGYYLSQDDYGAPFDVSLRADTLPILKYAVGRLVETPAEVMGMLAAYTNTNGQVLTPASALVTGYDFLADAAQNVEQQLQAGIGTGSNAVMDTLIAPNGLAPYDPASWNADQLRALLLGKHHDLIFLAGHFSAVSAEAADLSTRMLTTDLMNSNVDLTNAIVFSVGCHSGYNIVNEHDILDLTLEPDWAQAFASKGATLIAGTAYQYGDTDFLEYSERLYLEFSQQLLVGSGPVDIGKALVAAKQRYLADTPVMRGIHEKALLEATLFGLPMLKVDMPYGRFTPPPDISIVTSVHDFGSNPATTLGLKYAEVSILPTLTAHMVEMTSTTDLLTTYTATYLTGSSGAVTNPAEPVLPLEMRNVSYPANAVPQGKVLRGVVFKGGTYTDQSGILPLTGAATFDLRGVHIPFFTDAFYPARPWNVNYFDALVNSDAGITRLAVTPAQYLSSSPDCTTGTLRKYNQMDFRLYYSGNISSIIDSTNNVTITPGKAAPPSIIHVSTQPDTSGNLLFTVEVVGDPSAGIQEVWVTYGAVSGAFYGSWQPLPLIQDLGDTRLWHGSLALQGTDPENVRFMVQAVNGVGLVTMLTNQGAGFQPGVDPGAPPAQTQAATQLILEPLAASGAYGDQVSVAAFLTSNGNPVEGQVVAFRLGSQGRSDRTDANGRVAVQIDLLSLPGPNDLRVSFPGTTDYQASSASMPFTILKANTTLSLTSNPAQVKFGNTATLTATLKDIQGRALADKLMSIVVNSHAGSYYPSGFSDGAGQITVSLPDLQPDSYTVSAYFAGDIPLPDGSTTHVEDDHYQPSTASATLVVISPIDSIPPNSTISLNPANPNGGNGWFTSNVHFSVSSSDNPGGTGVTELRCVLDPGTVPSLFDNLPPGCNFSGYGVDVTQEGEHTLYAASMDVAGNKETPISQSFKIDKTPPTLNPVISPRPIILNGTASVSPGATDSQSGIASASCTPITTSSVGSKTATCTATDRAGNTTSVNVNYQVIYRFDGFLQPINDTGHMQACGNPCPVSIFKGGSTIPVKFQLKDAKGIVVQASVAPLWITPQQGGATSNPVDEGIYSDPASNGIAYFWDGSQYHYNWSTKNFARGYFWRIGVTLDDGQTYYVYIGLR